MNSPAAESPAFVSRSKKLRENYEMGFDEWARDVRDAAKYRSEGPRRLKFGNCSAEYEIAPLPIGGVAMRYDCMTSESGSSSCWDHYENREIALREFLETACRFFDVTRDGPGNWTQADLKNVPRMRERLSSDTLFGFDEPEPVAYQEWIAERVCDDLDSMVLDLNDELLDVVRGMKAPSKSGSFFDIPVPPQTPSFK